MSRLVPAALRVGILLMAVAAAGCGGTAEAVDPATTYGHRIGEDAEGRRTLALTPPAPGEEYFVYPAVVTEVTVRTGPPLPDGRRPVELVLEGALPDGCLALHDVREERLAHHLHVTLEMRRPKGALCPTVVRPYRFYHPLAEPLPEGPYTLRVNGAVHPFEVLPERPARRGA